MQIGRRHFFERRAERGHELRRQIGNEPDGVRQDRLVDPRQADRAHRRVERGEQQVFGHHVCAGQAVEQRGFARIGIADQGDHRPRRRLAPIAVEPARAADLVEFAADARHAVADHAPVGLDLGLARTAEEAEAAALAFEVGPAAHEAPCLVIEMRQFDLQPAFGGRRALAEDFEDQPGAVDHLALELFLQIALLDRAERTIDDDQFRFFLRCRNIDALDLALAEQRCRAYRADRHRESVSHHDADRTGEPLRLLQP